MSTTYLSSERAYCAAHPEYATPLTEEQVHRFLEDLRTKTLRNQGMRNIIADVLLPDGTTVDYKLVKDSWCWGYRKPAPRDTVLEGLEAEARAGRKGLWADPQPVPPWEWRKL